MSDELLLQNLNDKGVLKITLNQGQKRNALSKAMLLSLLTALSKAEANKQVKVIVLAATGPAFCAGHDLKEVEQARKNSDGGKQFFAELFVICSKVMQAIVNHPKVIIAEVHSIATAAGCQLVASCDLAVAASNAQFATPGVHIGLFCSTPMVALSRNIAPKHAMQMLLTGEMISAKKAKKIGLVNQVVDGKNLIKAVTDLSEKIADKSSSTVTLGKKTFYQQLPMNLADAYQHTCQVMTHNMLQADAKEGISAFVEKRKPQWQD